MTILQFSLAGLWVCIGSLILITVGLSHMAPIIREIRGMPDISEENESNEISCYEILERVEGGICKRIDENRELIELIQRESPAFFSKFPYALEWLKSQDRFLVALSESNGFNFDRCLFQPRNDMGRLMPRPMPIE